MNWLADGVRRGEGKESSCTKRRTAQQRHLHAGREAAAHAARGAELAHVAVHRAVPAPDAAQLLDAHTH